jgi:phosphoglycolate phosphatase
MAFAKSQTKLVPSRIKAVLFDLDGTLVDSADDLCSAANTVLEEAGLNPLTVDAVRGMIGDGAPKLAERALLAAGGKPEDVERFTARFLKVYELNAAVHTSCYPRVIDSLAELTDMGLFLGVVTNKFEAATTRILSALSIRDFFSVVVGGDTVEKRKPDPMPVLEALYRLGFSPDEVLMVGDNIHDVESARAAGVHSAAVTYGYHHAPPASFGANYLIDSIAEVPILISGLNAGDIASGQPGEQPRKD